MTAPQQQGQSRLDLERTGRGDPRARGPVTFADDESLARRLDRRNGERRRRERHGHAAPTSGVDLGTRELCHDLRQPLASAVVLTHMLEKQTGLTADGRERLELLQAELARMAGMLTAHLEAAAPVLVDVAELVRVVCRPPACPTAAPVELSVEPVPLVLGDGDQLTRLVANLVTNARTAAGTGGRVRVHVGSCEGAVSISVEDSGGDTTQGSSCGFGLGLLIVDAVLRRHGGSSTCTASDLGGLRVAVTIPAGRPQQDGGAAR